MILPVFTWFDFFSAAIILLLAYFAMQLAHQLLNKQPQKSIWLVSLKKWLYTLLKVYEVIVFLILSSVFIFIHPALHSLILLAITVFSFSHIRNYFSGKIASLDENISRGKRLNIGDAQGVIVHLGQLGIQLRTATGIRYVSYSQLFKEGYSLVAAEEIGGFYQFELSPKNASEAINPIQQLKDLFLMTPYIDPSRAPELRYLDSETQTIEAKILIREGSSLEDLIQLIQEWGYQSKMKQV